MFSFQSLQFQSNSLICMWYSCPLAILPFRRFVLCSSKAHSWISIHGKTPRCQCPNPW